MNKPNTEFDLFAAFRDGFPALKQWTYMDVAARGVLSRETRAALDAHLDDRMLNGCDKERFFALIERARGRFAQLMNAEPAEITYTKNISEGLNMVATGIDWKSGDNVVTSSLEFPSNFIPWKRLEALGVTLHGRPCQSFLAVPIVTDDEAVEAMVYIAERLKVITEPAAAVTLVAVEKLRDQFTPDSKIVLIFCGGNTGVNDLCGYLQTHGSLLTI